MALVLSFRVDSNQNLAALREEMTRQQVEAFLVPSGDSHQSEYISPTDKRIKWVSGFSGSSGFAVVTLDKAALWTDGRWILEKMALQVRVVKSTRMFFTDTFFKLKMSWIATGSLWEATREAMLVGSSGFQRSCMYKTRLQFPVFRVISPWRRFCKIDRLRPS